jgi:hypothetical protein
MKDNEWQVKFRNGKTPRIPDGFYSGRMLKLFPLNLNERLLSLLLRMWMPWKGKYFYRKRKRGENVLPLYMALPIHSFVGESTLIKKEKGNVYAFPFAMFLGRSVVDGKRVLKLDYNLPKNSDMVRLFVDEFVEVKSGVLLGRVLLVIGRKSRVFGFFELTRQ